MQQFGFSSMKALPSIINGVWTLHQRAFSFQLRSYSVSHAERDRVQHPNRDLEFLSTTKIASPSRIHKLIASQTDPLLALEIFDLASRQPDFHHSYATYHTLILKLGRSHHFSLMEELLGRLRGLRCPVPAGLFSKVIQIYGDAQLPEKAVKTFYSVVEFNCNPTSKHLNRVLAILVSHRGFLRQAFDLFRVAHKYGVSPNTSSYNTMMRAFCYNDELSVAYKLFGQMFKRDVMPDVESYRILMQVELQKVSISKGLSSASLESGVSSATTSLSLGTGVWSDAIQPSSDPTHTLLRAGYTEKSQVNKAVDLLEDMLNKGFVPDTLSYTTLLNSLCRKKKLREAYKLLCRMKVKGCNPNIVHYNTMILGLCREGRSPDATKVLNDMHKNGCVPNLVSYRTLVVGFCNQGMYDEAWKYMEEMVSKGFSPHFSVAHSVVKGFCNAGKVEEACRVLRCLMKRGEAPHNETWGEIVPRILCNVEEMERLGDVLEEVMKIEIEPHMRIVDAGAGLEDYLVKKIRAKSRNRGRLS